MVIIFIIGTRPEAIEMAPVILALKLQPWAEVRAPATAQHQNMLDQVLNFFDIQPDIELNIMSSQSEAVGLDGTAVA